MNQKTQATIFILALGFLLRIIPINQSYWLDESINVRAASSKTYIDLVTNYAIGDFHPPLYHILLKSWIFIFGNMEIYTRLLSVIFGLITLITTIQISKIIFKNQKLDFFGFSIWVFLLPPMLLSLSGLDIYYSGESRMYALASMGTSLSVYFLLKILPTYSIKKFISEWFLSPYDNFKKYFKTLFSLNSFGLIISLIIMLLSDYVPWLLFPIFFIFLPIQSLLALLLTSPWWPYFYKQLQTGLNTASDFPLWGQIVGGLSLKNIVLIPIKFTIGRVTIDNKIFYGVFAIFILSLLGFLILNVLKQINLKTKLKNLFPLLWLLFPIIVGIILSSKISLLSYFRFLFVLPAFYIVIVQGLLNFKKQFQRSVLIVFMLITMISASTYIFFPRFHRENWRGLVSYINETDNQNSLVLIPNLAQADPYLFYQKNVPIFDSPEVLFAMPQTVYLIRYVQEVFDPQDVLRITLEDLGYKVINQRNFNGVVVWKYQRNDELFALDF